MHRIIMSLLVIFLQGCVAMPTANLEKILNEMYNVSSSGESQLDNSKYIRVSKIFCSRVIVFELYQDTAKHNSGIVLLQAGTNTITNIGNGKALNMKINGKVHSFKSSNALTEHETYDYGYGVTQPFSHKTFIVPESFIRDVASSKEFLSKVYLLNNSYVEGKCSAVTLREYKNTLKGSPYVSDVTQEGVDTANKVTALNGFRKFVRLMDATAW